MLSDNEFLYSISGAQFDDELNDLGGIESSVSSDDEGSSSGGNRGENRLNEVLGVVG